MSDGNCREDLDDLTGQGQPAGAVAFGPDDIDVTRPSRSTCPILPEPTDLAGPQPTRVHQREERDRLPSPRGGGLEPGRGSEEPFDLMSGQQVGARMDDRGFPVAGEHVGVVEAPVICSQQPRVAYVGHPRPVAGRNLPSWAPSPILRRCHGRRRSKPCSAQ